MKIASYEVQAGAQRSYMKVESAISTTKWVKEADLPLVKEEAPEVAVADLTREAAKQLLGQAAQDKKPAIEGFKSYQPAALRPLIPMAMDTLDLKIKLLEAMIYALTGKRVEARLREPKLDFSAPTLDLSQVFGLVDNTPRPEPMRQVTETRLFFYESESISYKAQALINTADGKSISVDISMYMSREFLAQTNTTVIWDAPKDPLVINYAGTAASLTERTYSFDLALDGSMQQMHFAAQGSGFLAVDWDGSGVIKDGSQLFGPRSGDGFAELRAYDADGNGWIDENDAIFSQLVVWSKDEEGNDQIFTLLELGIGAIYLGNIDTQFSLTDNQNSTQGIMRSTSFFLKENGGAGTVSHIDLMI